MMPDVIVILSSSLLILVLIVLRAVLRKRLDARLVYSFWLLAAVRLLLPFNLGSLRWSLASLLTGGGNAYSSGVIGGADTIGVIGGADGPTAIFIATDPLIPGLGDGFGFSLPVLTPWTLLRYVWLLGVVLFLLLHIAANIRFAYRLKKQAIPYYGSGATAVFLSFAGKKYCKVPPIYLAEGLSSPCLFGIFRPKIYLNAQMEEPQFSHIIAHEVTHYRHGDHLWALVRLLCLALHWYNPLVWWAASLSRRDAELACDASVLAHAEKEDRIAYGRTLLELIAKGKGHVFHTATMMMDGKKTMRERMERIVRTPKRFLLWGLIALFVVVLVAVPCFTGATEDRADISLIGGADGPTDIVLKSDPAGDLYALRTSYVGDAPAVGEILTALNISRLMGDFTFELDTYAEPYGIILYFSEDQGEISVVDLYMNHYAQYLLALVENASYVRWEYFINGVAFSNILNADEMIKSFGESEEDFRFFCYTRSLMPPWQLELPPDGEIVDGAEIVANTVMNFHVEGMQESVLMHRWQLKEASILIPAEDWRLIAEGENMMEFASTINEDVRLQLDILPGVDAASARELLGYPYADAWRDLTEDGMICVADMQNGIVNAAAIKEANGTVYVVTMLYPDPAAEGVGSRLLQMAATLSIAE